jgi:hypothetical protein
MHQAAQPFGGFAFKLPDGVKASFAQATTHNPFAASTGFPSFAASATTGASNSTGFKGIQFSFASAAPLGSAAAAPALAKPSKDKDGDEDDGEGADDAGTF